MPWHARKSDGTAHWLAPLLSLAVAAVAMAGGALAGPTRPTTALPAYPEVAQWLAEPSRPPAPDADPGAVATFFATHPAALDVDLAHRYPRVVGALDGAPPALREVANADLAGRPDLLLYDPRGDGRIAAVLGDLRRADRIAVLIPGMNTTLANYATGLGHVLRRSPQWQAGQLWEAARARQPGARLAVIAWLGYDPPDALGPAAARQDRAAAGASALLRFVAGLAAQRPGAGIVLIGHSYGSVLAGLAAPDLVPAVTDIVALGSPGLGGAHTVADLHSSARVWAGSAAGDWTRALPGLRLGGLGHGRLPCDPAFGALALPVATVVDHDGYYAAGSDALPALAAIALGAPPGAPAAGEDAR